MTSFISLKLSKDPVVREALVCQLEREGAWTKKSSTAVECQEMLEKLSETHSITTLDNCLGATKMQKIYRLKKAGKSLVAEQYKERANEASERMEVQGDLARLLEEEKTNMDWQSLIFSVPHGVMSFAVRSSTNSLATPDNLARWKKKLSIPRALSALSFHALWVTSLATANWPWIDMNGGTTIL